MEDKPQYESYKIVITDFSQIVNKPKPEDKAERIKKFEIWVGNYHLGQGHHGSYEPEKVGEEEATSFKIACYKHELRSTLDGLDKRMERGDTYIEDIHFGHLYYDPKENRNSWLGKYYESYIEAMKSFK